MMNYRAKYTITKCSFHPDADYYIDRQTAFICVLTLAPQGIPEIDIFNLDAKVSLGDAISIESSLGGGIGFPLKETAIERLSNNHMDLMRAFIYTITQEHIVLFEDGIDRYSPVVMELLLDLAINAGKKVTCISVLPAKYQGRHRSRHFHSLWSEIEKHTDNTILYDFEFLHEEQQSIPELTALRGNALFNNIAQLWIDTKKSDQ